MGTRGNVLLTGATGFVGSSLWPALEARGYTVHGMTRRPSAARLRHPHRSWRHGDVERPASLLSAMEGCDHAFYLVHSMGAGGESYREREVAAAGHFARAAARAELSRVVYLGGIAPAGPPSEHLRSRLEVGSQLRAGSVPAIELRASMIIGPGSASWTIVRDLAARLPFMILPRWLNARTEPLSIQDVLAALAGALKAPLPQSRWYDLPGPQELSGAEILVQTARQLGLKRPWMVKVPVLSPWLSSHWVRLVTRAEWSVAREIVVGLTHDVLAVDDRYWKVIGHGHLQSFAEAARAAIMAERASADARPIGLWRSIENAVMRWRGQEMSEPQDSDQPHSMNQR